MESQKEISDKSHNWVNALEKANKREGFLGANKDKEVKHFETLDEMGSEEAYEASITEIYDYSKKVLKKAPDEVKIKINECLAELITIESDKLKDTIKEMNATWRTALKVILAATIILSPIALLSYYFDQEIKENAEKELNQLEIRQKRDEQQI